MITLQEAWTLALQIPASLPVVANTACWLAVRTRLPLLAFQGLSWTRDCGGNILGLKNPPIRANRPLRAKKKLVTHPGFHCLDLPTLNLSLCAHSVKDAGRVQRCRRRGSGARGFGVVPNEPRVPSPCRALRCRAQPQPPAAAPCRRRGVSMILPRCRPHFILSPVLTHPHSGISNKV